MGEGGWVGLAWALCWLAPWAACAQSTSLSHFLRCDAILARRHRCSWRRRLPPSLLRRAQAEWAGHGPVAVKVLDHTVHAPGGPPSPLASLPALTTALSHDNVAALYQVGQS